MNGTVITVDKGVETHGDKERADSKGDHPRFVVVVRLVQDHTLVVFSVEDWICVDAVCDGLIGAGAQVLLGRLDGEPDGVDATPEELHLRGLGRIEDPVLRCGKRATQH